MTPKSLAVNYAMGIAGDEVHFLEDAQDTCVPPFLPPPTPLLQPTGDGGNSHLLRKPVVHPVLQPWHHTHAHQNQNHLKPPLFLSRYSSTSK